MDSNSAAFFAAALVILILAAPLAARLFPRPVLLAGLLCPTGQEAIYIRLDRDSVVNVLNPGDPRPNWMPNFQQDHFFYARSIEPATP